MNVASFPPSSNHEPPPLPTTAPEGTESKTPLPGRHNGKTRVGPVRWIQENTFAPEWLPEQLRHPLIGYLAAGLIEGAAASLILLFLALIPSFAFHGVLTLVGVVLVALGWGAGPGLFASLVGTFVLYFVMLPPDLLRIIDDPGDGIGLLMYLLVGVTISLLAGQNEWARRQAKEVAQLLAQAEARSRFDADRLRTVLDVLPSAVLIASNQGQLLALNQATRTLWGGDVPLGVDVKRFPENKLWWAQSGKPVATEEWTLVRALTSGTAVLNDEIEIEAVDGQHRVLLTSAAPIRDESGAITGAVMSAQDISERRRLEREVAERAQELEAIFEAMVDGVFVYDADGHISRVNAVGRQILGADALPRSRPMRERAARRSPLDENGQLVPYERIPGVRILHGEVLTGAQAVDIYFPTPEGGMLAYNTSGTPLRSAEGIITGAIVVTRDVTERHRLEREGAERAQELEAIFEAMTDGIALLDDKGGLVRTNHAFHTLHGVEQNSEYMTLPLDQRLTMLGLADEQGRPMAVEARPISRLLKGETLAPGVDVKIKKLDGCDVVLNVGGAPIRDQRGQVSGCVEVFRDVTVRQRLEQRTRERLDTLVAMAEAMVQIRPATPSLDEATALSPLMADGTMPLVARRLAELTKSVLGCRRVSIVAVDAATGQLHPVTEVGLPPDQEQAWWASWFPARYLEERYGAAVATALRAGESALLSTRHLPERSWYTLFGAQSGQIVPMQLGEELVGILLVDYPEPDHDYSTTEESLLTGTLTRLGALVLERDRLLRGWAETRANELALGETKAQMNTFLGVASHELKTPLTSLKLSLQLSERRLRKLTRSSQRIVAGGESELQGAVEQLSRTAHQMERMESLVNDLVDVSRIQAGRLELRPEPSDLVAIVREVVVVQQEATLGRNIEVQIPLSLSVPVYTDAGRIEQVVTNYLTNALKYSPAECPVEVGVEVEPQQARVWVRDQGPGLPLTEQEHIWERFHRAQGVEVQSGTGVGLGLGLYISRMIVERHHGQVGVQSTPGQGSTFWFTLPLEGLDEEVH